VLDRIRYQILLVVGIATTLGLIATIAFYSRHQEQTLLAQNERAVRKLTDTVAEGLQSVMLAGSADIAQAFADRLKKVPEITEFRILRTDGLEAFRDNKTIDDVNARRGEEQFLPREEEEVIRGMQADDPDLRRAVETSKPVVTYNEDSAGYRQLVFLAPLANDKLCYKCHGKSQPVRGVMRLATSLAPVERDIFRARQESLAVFAVVLIATVLLTGYMLGRIVVRPIEKVTRAMARVSGGDLDYKVAERSGDELGRMGASFNQMTRELQNTYRNLRREQNKLTTVIETATEGIVVTDAAGSVVLVNPAASALLGKSREEVVAGGFYNIVDNRSFIENCLHCDSPADISYNNRNLQVRATVIHVDQEHIIGSVALVRDITQETRLEDDLRKTSTTDALTGLYNRRFLDATLSSEYIRAERSRASLSIVMFDVDHFKKFNDTHGHDQGDRVLQMVSRCLKETIRPFDFPCRYGGEEYVAILPGMAAEDALQLAERLRIKVANTEVDGLHVQISLGVATYPVVKVATAESLIEAADAALYRAKESGRNRVAVAGAIS
jgi:diguanylate cyclase (GGDEF)-like protein/PAS domain S-box-containing protein